MANVSRILLSFAYARRFFCLLLLVFAANPSAMQAFEVQLIAPGNDEIEKAIENTSLVFEAKIEDLTSVQDITAAARADYGQILSTLYRNGYYSGTISIRIDGREASDISPFDTLTAVNRIVIRVNPGRIFKFGTANIAPLAPNTTLPEGYATGEPAESTMIGNAATAAIGAWRDTGRAKAQVDRQEITANHNNNTLDASIHLQPGPVIRFGNLEITNNGNVKDSRIREIAGFPTGKVFSPQAINTVANRLRETGTFSSVALTEGEAVSSDGTMNISLELVEEKPHRFGFGAEVYSSAGISLSAYWTHRNVFGGAEKLEFKAEVSGIGGEVDGIDYRLQARLSRPGTFSPLNLFHVGAEIAELHEPTYRSRLALVEIGMLRTFSDRLDVSASLAYRFSDVNDSYGFRTFNHLVFTFTGLDDARDDKLNPKSGTYIEAEAAPYIGLAGTASGARIFGETRGFYSLGANESLTLAGRLQVGSILGSSLKSTAPEMLFYSGGNNTVRGQPYQSLNVQRGDIETGGLSYLGVSVEARVEMNSKIGVVAFTDFGFVGSTRVPGADGEWQSGAGVGVRYFTGFGPIRFDIAVPTSGKKSGMQFYVGIGQAF